MLDKLLTWLRGRLAGAAPVALLACAQQPSEPPPPLPPLPSVVVRQAAPPPGPARDPVELVVAFSGEIRGEVEPCGCPTLPYGGFVRREALLRSLEGADVPLFQLDGGQALVKGLIADRRGGTRPRAELVLDLLVASGLDLLVPGPSDLLPGGWSALAEGARRRGVALVSANWVDARGAPVARPWLVVERRGVRLGVVGISGEPGPESGLGARPAEAALEAALHDLAGRADLQVVVTNAEPEVVRRLADHPGVALVLATWGDGRAPAGTRVPVVRVPPRGRYLDLLHLVVGSDPDRPVETAGPAIEVLERVTDLRRRLARGPPARDALQERLAAALDELRGHARGRNLLLEERRPLGGDLDRAGTRAERLLARHRERVQEAAEAAAARPPEEDAAPYATAGACASCHVAQYARWTYTDHKDAWFALQRRGEGANPECLPCHTLGYGEPGGLGELTIANTRRFGGVQCESCHGPMGGHPDTPLPHREVEPGTCLRCHDAANDPDFEVQAAWGRVACPSDEEALPPG